jgi:hypothetical protein
MTSNQKLILIFGLTLVSVALMLFVERINQDKAYHLFADSRLIAQIPNFFNVVTNTPFVVLGILGVRICLIKRSTLPYLLFFISIFMTGIGSGYYHLWPDNFTLAWDRLPLAISIIALLCAVVSDCISKKFGLWLLMPLISLAIAAVLYWYCTELKGQGDLRPYILAQFMPIALLPLITWMYKGNQKGCAYVWKLLGVYVLAKIAEALDTQIYNQLQVISGHSIKHLLAGFATYIVYAALRRRLLQSR